jgi:phospholipase A1
MPSTALRYSILTATTLAAGAVHAGDPSSCTEIADDRARLACYDASLARGTNAHAVPPAVSAARSPPGDATVAASPDATSGERSLIGERWSRYGPTPGNPLLVRLHNPNYLTLRHSSGTNETPSSPTQPPVDIGRDTQRDELEFQVSVKARLWESADHFYAAWLGYTQQSNWQALNAAQSRPFRESDYQPEMMLVAQPDMPLGAGLRWQLLNLGIVHQSNGRSDPASRSWNRVYAQFGVENDAFAGGKLAMLVRPWLRLHEQADRDDNPDITDYLGYGDVTVLWRKDQQTLTFTGRLNPRTGKGAAQVEWSMPAIDPFRFYVRAFTGYGESLLDYNFRQTVVGAGFSLNDLL